MTSWDTYWSRPPTRPARVYGLVAQAYRKYFIKPNLDRLMKKHFSPGARVMHAGCGGGEVDRGISESMAVLALDMSAPALKIYRGYHPEGTAVRGTIFALPVAGASLDGVYHLGLLEHFTEGEIQQVLTEFARVLKPGSKMIVFWPPRFGLSVRVLGAAHFVLNVILKKRITLHPAEITLLRSKSHALAVFENANLRVEDFYFGYRDLFTQCMIVVSKPRER